MTFWMRFVAGAGLALVLFGVVHYLSSGAAFDARGGEELPGEAHRRTGQIFWSLIFVVVMLTSLLAAARRGWQQLRGFRFRPHGR